ncbi:MAG: DUF1592 domain-containing protein [Acidobacteria bacterium]|nr:DUF1592 domain-containing protein [Acidobacteriota bacterium]
MQRQQFRRRTILPALGLLSLLGIAWIQAAENAPAALEPAFAKSVAPFLKKNCLQCHNTETAVAGVRLEALNASLEDRHLTIWEHVEKKIADGSMPPKGLPQPSAEERKAVIEWITRALEVARARPTPKNGMARRLTIAQYRNTLRDLLLLDDNDLTEALPPDAVSKDGFVNNKETLQLNPLLTEAYFEIAEEALSRVIVNPDVKPAIQKFRLDLGEGVNPNPIPEKLILGAGSELLENKDVLITQPRPVKPFPFEPVAMRTKFRFIEGYQGNDTVRGWREYDSIYHAVFADVRGSHGYPKGQAYSTAPEGLLLRPAIPNDEIFTADGTYGPKANFKIPVRELPNHGRFRVTVNAAKYDDGLLLDEDAASRPEGSAGAVTARGTRTGQTVEIPTAGLYQVDVYKGTRGDTPPSPDASRLSEGLGGEWKFESPDGLTMEGNAKLTDDSPFGKAIAFSGMGTAAVADRTPAMNVGTGDFTVAAWIHPRQQRRAGLVAAGGLNWMHGWLLMINDNKGMLRFEASSADTQSAGSVQSLPGVIRHDVWQHVAAIVKRGGKNQTVLYVNGYAVAKGDISDADLDNAKMALRIGRVPAGPQFRGDMDEVRLYRRALSEAELQALIEPGREFAIPPPEKAPELSMRLGARRFAGTLHQPSFLALRLPAGPLEVKTENTGVRDIDRVVFTPLRGSDPMERRFLTFEKRAPRVGVHLGFRRDCGSTLAPVGPAQQMASTTPGQFVFEGSIRNYPNPNVEKDNVNYLAGVREIGVRSEYTDGRDMPRLAIQSVEFEGPYYDSWPPASHRSIFIDSPAKANPAVYARQIIRNFATRAFRRPVTAAEEAALIGVFNKTYAAGRDFERSVKDALLVVLTSPQFLFLVESSASPAPEPLNAYELASKLSYFLWNAPPDRTTLRLAANGTLRARLDAEVDRMISSPRASQFIREFASQWLALDKFQVLEPDKKSFPRMTRDIRAHLKDEPVAFIEHLLRNNLPVKNLVASDFIVANEVVASYYDLADKTEDGFRFAVIPHGRPELGGVLTQPAIMAGLSDGRESNPVKRGNWIARRIVAEPPDDPPPNVPALKEAEKGMTLRERIEAHRNQSACRQCHAKIDPYGVAMEEFDAGGRLKTHAADARATLPDDKDVAGLADLQRHLIETRIDQVAFSVLKHMQTYANGRTLAYNEVNFLKQDGLKLKPGGYRMKDMIRYVVNSKAFLEK